MHEMSIAGAVLDVVLRHARGRRVTHVQLQVGHLRQVVPAALDFSWSLITSGTEAEGSTLGIETIAAAGRCRACGVVSGQPAFPMRCGACGALDVEITAGEELEIDWLDVTEAGAALEGRGT